MTKMACLVFLVVLLSSLISNSRAGEDLASAARHSPPDTIAARAQGCATCHGNEGQGTHDNFFPRIAGKPEGYLFNQLQNFRDGRRSYPPMSYLLAYLHDDYLREIAHFFSQQKLPYDAPENGTLPAAQLAIGEALVKRGDSSRGIPACMACHGEALTGIEPGIPGLIGLRSRYITAQLEEAWRAGTRHAASPDCMSQISSRLTDTQITAVASWLAAQPATGILEAAPAGSWKTPVPCGSQPQ
jgi:cytochrome c553